MSETWSEAEPMKLRRIADAEFHGAAVFAKS
jgi:hypothetical protein